MARVHPCVRMFLPSQTNGAWSTRTGPGSSSDVKFSVRTLPLDRISQVCGLAALPASSQPWKPAVPSRDVRDASGG